MSNDNGMCIIKQKQKQKQKNPKSLYLMKNEQVLIENRMLFLLKCFEFNNILDY